MPVIQVSGLRFTYEGSPEPVFNNLTFNMDRTWRLGLVGRNGRGKTTLLRLLAGELEGGGMIYGAGGTDLFPLRVDARRPARDALIDALAPFTAWEAEMERLAALGSPESAAGLAEIQLRYDEAGGYGVRAALAREASLLGIPPGEMDRVFGSFSPGEQARLMLAALFLRPDRFLLIDEPTNHLDMDGRAVMAEYLRRKSGFLVVSHDRDFLDTVCDHILALEKQGARVVAGNYTSYREDKRRADAHERAEKEKLARDIARLRASSREKAAWSDRTEASKLGSHSLDRGYIGHKSAKMMKRAKAIQNRVDARLEEKEKLLKNLEYTAEVRVNWLEHPSRVLVRLEKAGFAYGDRALFSELDLEVGRGVRLAVTGPNGAGKTTLLRLIDGSLEPSAGRAWRAPGLVVSALPQTSGHLRGTPRDIASARGLPLPRFLMLMRKFDMPQESFDRDAAGFSLGEKKKLLIALSLAAPAHLYLWDEPLNDVDPESREQIEDLLAHTEAPFVFIEHERTFVERVATRVVRLG
ncbi:MAG TPA: ABC-F family ATP-binding cassette domain-containing protein [Candidatus Limnocylindria bacterium]|nr:ABC-F family ATP-binding cassette domain-containing protein [Candidatus Limnocylindria bacterium]